MRTTWSLRLPSGYRYVRPAGNMALVQLEAADGWLTLAWKRVPAPPVGPKTAAIVLQFALGKPAFPVDTHIHRVSRRLGLIGPRVSRERAHAELERQIAPEGYYAFHLNVIQHGRQVCASRKPNCAACVLRDLCDYYGGETA